MKIRNGFISNSSSSSFIGVIGKIVDTEKFKQFKKSNEFDIIVKSATGINEELESYCGDFFGQLSKLDETKHAMDYLIFEHENGDPGCNDDGEIYDSEIDDFSKKFQLIGNTESGIDVIQFVLYSGRDG
jgi:hypothetical protein